MARQWEYPRAVQRRQPAGIGRIELGGIEVDGRQQHNLHIPLQLGASVSIVQGPI